MLSPDEFFFYVYKMDIEVTIPLQLLKRFIFDTFRFMSGLKL